MYPQLEPAQNLVNPPTDEMKYHPLLLENTFMINLLKVTSEVDIKRKHVFLQTYFNSLKNLFVCNKCNEIMKENSVAFSCSHHFCGTCSKKLNSCANCGNENSNCESILKNYSKILTFVEMLQKNFNAENVFFEILKFLLSPSQLLKQQKLSFASTSSVNKSPTNFQEYQASSKKFTIAGKRFKTLTKKSENFKRKLEFSPNLPICSPHSLENDSECLFVDSKKKKFSPHEPAKWNNCISYLEQQPSLNDNRNSSLTKSSARKRAKRKLIESNISVDEIADKRCSKTRRTDDNMELAITLEKLDSSYSPRSSTYVQSDDAEGGLSSTKKKKSNSQPNSLNNEDNCKKKNRTWSKNKDSVCVKPQQKLHDSNANDQKGSVDRKKPQEMVKVCESRQEKENSLLSLPDPEIEGLTDVNLWNHNEKVQRKKRSLFKSVKERNRRSLLFERDVSSSLADCRLKFAENMEMLTITQSNESKSPINGGTEKSPIDISVTVKDKCRPVTDNCTISETTDFKLAVLLTKIKDEDLSRRVDTKEKNVENNFVAEAFSPAAETTSTISEADKDKELQLKPSVEKTKCVESSASSRTNNSKVEIVLRNTNKITPTASGENQIGDSSQLPPARTLCNINSSSMQTVISDIDSNFMLTPSNTCPKPLNDSVDSVLNAVAIRPRILSPITISEDEYNSSTLGTAEKSCNNYITVVSDIIDNSFANEKSVITTPSQSIIASSTNSNGPNVASHESNQMIVEVRPKVVTKNESILSYKIDLSQNITQKSIMAHTKLKCAQLKKTINVQNEKLLVNFRQNFCLASPKMLSVEKYKGQKNIDYDIRNGNNLTCFHPKLSQKVNESSNVHVSTASKSPFKSPQSTIESCSLHDESLTVPASPRTKSVSCQTTSDLHFALLVQEFPLLVKEHVTACSVYDPPCKSTLIEAKENREPITPQVSISRLPDNFTSISSITSSEKRIFNDIFMDNSVLCDSFHGIVDMDRTTEDISFEPLPSAGKKSTIYNCLNDNSTCDASSTSVGRTPCSSLKTNLTENDVDVTVEKQVNAKQLTNDSNEIDFADFGAQTGTNLPIKDSGSEKQRCELNQNAGLNSDSILITSDPINLSEQTCIKADISRLEANLKKVPGTSSENHLTDDGIPPNSEDSIVDDDEIDFIAGTPNSYSKRCVDDTLEKLMTQSFSLKNNNSNDIFQSNDKSDQTLFHSVGSRSQPSHQSPVDNCCLPPRSVKVVIQKPADSSFQLPKISGSIDEPSVDLFNGTVSGSTNVGPSIVLAMTGLKDDDTAVVKSFCRRFSASLMDRVTEKTTHLAVRTDKRNRTARTFKYLQAIVNSNHIIAVGWLQACLDADKILDEEKFIPFDSSGECGPLRAYNAQKGMTPSPLSWLRDYCIFFTEPVPSACTLSQLHEIVSKTGAVVISTLRDFAEYPSRHHLIIVSDDEENSQTSNTDIANWLQKYHAVAVEFNWLLEVIGRNRLVPFADYELVEIPSNLMLKLNFPSEMLQYEKEDADDSE